MEFFVTCAARTARGFRRSPFCFVFLWLQPARRGLFLWERETHEEAEQEETQRKSFSQRLFDLEKFIVERDHFPFSSSQDKIEESLNRWWRLIINGVTQINIEQQIEIKRVKIQYSSYDIDKSTYEWNLNYNKFKCFLLENRRIPFARGDEKFLYGWLRRAKEDFQNYKLTEEQRQRFIDLAKLI